MSDENEGSAAEPEPSFGETIDELEQILGRIEGEQIDIDQLATELERATVLLERARAKVRKAEVEVAQIVQSLERNDEGDRE
ncbi:MAG TPA: exodeoxyribonuclease VII small subunit [Thermoanaerobaculia bacterium]|nr:exodeoxyribonuclease VII small subunit [Thermoanaerobaculia bacterium]